MDFVKYVEEDGIVRATATAASWGLDRVDQRDLPLNGDYSPPGQYRIPVAYPSWDSMAQER